jgi:DNA repair protein RecN (Recombination protein N)
MTAVYFGSDSDVFFAFSLRAGRFAGLWRQSPGPPGRWFGRGRTCIIAAMLLGLTIRDVVLIDRLSLAFRRGLCVLTGETGAGKSILLDALGLALGRRAEAGLVRAGAKEAAVAAEFAVGRNHPAHAILRAAGREDAGETIVLRRLLATDGRSRAFVNDEPSSVGLLRELGDSLVEIQGQFEQRGLLEPANHRMILDAFADHSVGPAGLARAWDDWREALARETAAARLLAASREEEERLHHHLAELDALAPEADEEAGLAVRRTLLQNAERLAETLAEAIGELGGDGGAQAALARATRRLERARERAQGLFDMPLAAAERAAAETADALAALESAARQLELDPRELEQLEERLFALRGLARKHQVSVADLPALRERMAAQLAAIEEGAENVEHLVRDTREARARFLAAAETVSRARARAARRLDAAVAAELAPLRLDKARFRTVLTPLDETEWSEHGCERVHFEIATTPGVPFGPLARIASGGELSRFMLALKLVLADTSSVPTLIFDEVDSGIGGAVAAAVGERLQRLGTSLQVLVVTHSPQVAARGAHHWRVAKRLAEHEAVTRVEELDADTRQEEIARMLSGRIVTAEARAAAASLIAGGRA